MQEVDEAIEFGNRFYEKIKDDLITLKDIHNTTDESKEEEEKIIIKSNKELKQNLVYEKEALIGKIIGQMYKGVLVDGEISIRKDGEIFPYKRQSNSYFHIQEIKTKILSHIHEVKEKISETNLDILEFVLSYVDEKERESSDIATTIKLPNFYYFCDMDTDYDDDTLEKIEFEKVNIIEVKANGEVYFYWQRSEENSRYNSTSLSEKQRQLLIKKYRKQIEETLKDLIDNQNKDISRLKDEVSKIKDKGSNLLVMATLKKESKEGGI